MVGKIKISKSQTKEAVSNRKKSPIILLQEILLLSVKLSIILIRVQLRKANAIHIEVLASLNKKSMVNQLQHPTLKVLEDPQTFKKNPMVG